MGIVCTVQYVSEPAENVNNESKIASTRRNGIDDNECTALLSQKSSCTDISRRTSTYIPGHQDRNHWAGDDGLLRSLYQAYDT
ncbi:hypothetical protein BOTNAR_0110g00180 [Botryotinia narcissicola]|uniref:Uncharacterized protein n=1 Tax=Botryotinia narcissicola TaxID=278944 RepID=A0A4Z1IMT1_9HELO|nr:hypothetical protein BOTNAR_0110g00180 [Botryotinia narcissicola]